MKAVVLLAGMGKRISAAYHGMHKALIPLNGKPLLSYILDNIRKSGMTEVVTVLGYHALEVENVIHHDSNGLDIQICVNDQFESTNNLASLLQAEMFLRDEDFIVINGDMVFDYHILQNLLLNCQMQVAVDTHDYCYQLDSPRVMIQNNRVIDLGRHMNIEDADGYAVGIYQFCKEHNKEFFMLGREELQRNLQAGFHDPLRKMFRHTDILPCDTKGYLWMDVDELSDVARAEQMLNQLL